MVTGISYAQAYPQKKHLLESRWADHVFTCPFVVLAVSTRRLLPGVAEPWHPLVGASLTDDRQLGLIGHQSIEADRRSSHREGGVG